MTGSRKTETLGWRGRGASASIPRLPVTLQRSCLNERVWPTLLLADLPMAECRIVRASVQASATEFAAWKAKASALGVPLSDLLRQAMIWTRA